jgi:hypothetical protein
MNRRTNRGLSVSALPFLDALMFSEVLGISLDMACAIYE